MNLNRTCPQCNGSLYIEVNNLVLCDSCEYRYVFELDYFAEIEAIEKIEEKYTEILELEDGTFTLDFVVDVQRFNINGINYESKSEAEWMASMLAKAINNLLAENRNP